MNKSMMKHDKICIQSLKVPTTIGVLEYERAIKQTLLLDIELGIDASIPALEDSLQQTVDYAALCSYIQEFGQSAEYQLIESFAEHLAQSILEHFQIQHLKLTVKKLQAIREAEFVSVTIERSI